MIPSERSDRRVLIDAVFAVLISSYVKSQVSSLRAFGT
jgi:hypothetical protein